MILPDQLTLICGFTGLIFIAFSGEQTGWPTMAMAHGSGAALFAGLMGLVGYITKKVLKKEALGQGDIKFMAVAGLWLGVDYLSVFFILSGILGVLFGGAWRLLKKGPVFPFGPALVFAFYACLLLKGAGFSGLIPLF